MNNLFYKEEKGNALFLILIAVALFAALSYAVTQSGRGGGGIGKEQALISASQITQYPASIRTAVTRMVITGTTAADLDFVNNSAADAADMVFNTSGGGVVEQDPPADSGATAWTYLDLEHATDGWMITGVGTDAATTGRDIIAVLPGLNLGVCEQINRGLSLDGTPLAEGTAVVITGDGAAAIAGNNASTFNSHNADPQAFACVDNGGSNTYYHALLEN